MTKTNIALAGVFVAALVFSVAMVATSPLAFADKGTCASSSGGQCASKNNSNGNPSQSATPEVPAGANPQPNPPRNK